jgi:hypothetical protein
VGGREISFQVMACLGLGGLIHHGWYRENSRCLARAIWEHGRTEILSLRLPWHGHGETDVRAASCCVGADPTPQCHGHVPIPGCLDTTTSKTEEPDYSASFFVFLMQIVEPSGLIQCTIEIGCVEDAARRFVSPPSPSSKPLDRERADPWIPRQTTKNPSRRLGKLSNISPRRYQACLKQSLLDHWG